MYLLLTDETNQRPGADVTFFIFGGLILPLDCLTELDARIQKARTDAGYHPKDELKFETNARPDHVSIEDATEAKRKVIDACLELNCKFIAHVIHHQIIQYQDLDQQVTWAADYVIGRFNYYLSKVKNVGICAVDNLPVKAQFRYLSEKFTQGLSLPDGKTVPLDRIKLFSATCSNASHASSAMDIALGSFRYCLNNPKKTDTVSEMMKNVVNLMWHERDGDTIYTGGRGLIVRPERDNIKFKPYKSDYDQMFAHINELLSLK